MKRSVIIGIVVVLICGVSVFALGTEKKAITGNLEKQKSEQTKEQQVAEQKNEKQKTEQTKEQQPKEQQPNEQTKEQTKEQQPNEQTMEQQPNEQTMEQEPIAKETSASKTEDLLVDRSYFSDAVFIGDSRTEGFQMHAGLTEASYLTAKGLNVTDVFEKPLVKGVNGKETIAQALKEKSYEKYYIMLGANELGWVYTDIFIDKYGQIIDLIREVNPKAIICVQAILPVTDKKSQSDAIYNNTNIVRFNELLKAMAVDKEVTYLNVSEAVQKEDGALQDEATTDGVHLNKDYCLKWLEYLREHIDKE